jgi:predicted RNase H-like nuclease
VRDVIAECDARLDSRQVSLSPWFVDNDEEVDALVDLICSRTRRADVVVVSLPETSTEMSEGIISSDILARDLAGAAHVAVISGRAAFGLTDRLGREFSVFQPGCADISAGI